MDKKAKDEVLYQEMCRVVGKVVLEPRRLIPQHHFKHQNIKVAGGEQRL